MGYRFVDAKLATNLHPPKKKHTSCLKNCTPDWSKGRILPASSNSMSLAERNKTPHGDDFYFGCLKNYL
jgi:hypothetical protein